MRYLALIFIVLASAITLNAQGGIDGFLYDIEQNNTSLKTLRHKAEADKVENHTGINMENPEVEFGYMWGNAAAEGDKYDFSIRQSFDFPTAYRHRRQIADGLDKEVDLEYDRQRREILLEARNIYIETVYRLNTQTVLTERLEKARQLFDAYQKRLDAGDVDIIEYNKTALNLLNTEKTYQLNQVEINNLKREIERLNGGLPLDISDFGYSGYSMPSDFDTWFTRIKGLDPILGRNAQQIEISRRQVQLNRALNLPKISVGYSNAYEAGGHFNGFIVGVSVPLWENKNKVRTQQARTIALETEYNDNTLQMYNMLYARYEKAERLGMILSEYEEALKYSNDFELLKTALDKGQMSLITFLQELTIYYETVDIYMETQRDYYLALVQLEQWGY